MDFNKYVKGEILSVISYDTIDINELASFLQNTPSITSLNLTGLNVGNQSITGLSKLKSLTSFTLSFDYISGKRAKELAEFPDSISLALASNEISNEGAQELAKLKNISILIGNTVSAEGAKQLAKLENIGAYVDNIGDDEDIQESTEDFYNKYVRDNTLSIQSCNTINISELVSFLQNNPNITSLDLEECNIGDEGAEALANSEHLENLKELDLVSNDIGDEGAKALIKALNDGKFPSLITLELGDNNIGDEVEKELSDALESNIERARQTNNINIPLSNPEGKNDILRSTKRNELPIITASAGLLLGLSIAYLAGAATLTPVGAAVAVFLAAVVVGALIGYGFGKFCEKVSEKRQKDPDMSTWGAVKSVFSDVFTTGHSESKLQA
jgi:hypothetical protein